VIFAIYHQFVIFSVSQIYAIPSFSQTRFITPQATGDKHVKIPIKSQFGRQLETTTVTYCTLCEECDMNIVHYYSQIWW